MIITIKDYNGFNNQCGTVISILAYIRSNKTVSINELITHFKIDHSEVRKYLIKERLPEYLKFFKSEIAIDKEVAKYKKIISEGKAILGKAKEISDSPNRKEGTVLQILNYFFTQSFQSQSYQTTNSVMSDVLDSLCKVSEFDIEDVNTIDKGFNSGYWFYNSKEHFYRQCIDHGNNSAWKSFEHHFQRPPFIILNKRMYERSTFRMAIENRWVHFRCTGWNKDKSIKILQFNDGIEGPHKRHTFDLKQFKAFIHKQKIELT